MTRRRGVIKHRWRDYRTPSGRRPVADFIAALDDAAAAEVVAAMRDVADNGLTAARHLRGDIWEVRAFSDTKGYRILFATEGNKGRVLLALEAYSKKTQRAPSRLVELAERRLTDWRSRARRTVR